MTINTKEINDDFARFMRHESMRANITQEELVTIIQETVNGFINP